MHSVSNIIYKRLSESDTIGIFRLYCIAKWVEETDSSDFISPMVAGSFATIGAFLPNGQLVGAGRAISDGASDGYIQDIVVDPEQRKQGIGGEIVRRLVAILEEAGVDWIGLVGAPNTLSFYKELGFEVLENHTPMRYKSK